MDFENSDRPAQRPPLRLFRKLAILAAVALFFLIVVPSGFIAYQLNRPIAPPKYIPLASLTENHALASGEDSKTSNSIIHAITPAPSSSSSPASTATLQNASPTSRTMAKKIVELVPEATQPTPELKAKARKINKDFVQILKDYEQDLAFDQKFPGRQDSQAYAKWRKESLDNYIVRYDHLEKIVAALQKDYPSELERFEEIYLGMLMERKDWAEAVNYCDRVRQDFDRSIYYCRQAKPWIQRPLSIGIIFLRTGQRALNKSHPAN